MTSASLPLMTQVRSHGNRLALKHDSGEVDYENLSRRVELIAAELVANHQIGQSTAVVFCISPDPKYVATMLGIWLAGGMAVPLNPHATADEMSYVIDDSDASLVLVDDSTQSSIPVRNSVGQLNVETIGPLDDASTSSALPMVSLGDPAMMLYTSGTTSRPKGVVLTHQNITSAVTSLVQAWRWRPDDAIPLFLPLHHIHGIVNVLLSALWVGATVDMLERFDLQAVLHQIAQRRYSVFMAVPTIYVKMIQAIQEMSSGKVDPIVAGFAATRLMVSGSAALPASVHQTWTAMTGVSLLERYGMTEIAMALSNPYVGDRRPGSVGQPLPGVEVRLVGEDKQVVESENVPGEIQIRGDNVFREYWKRPEATEAAFVDGWFRSGDIAIVVDGYYRIMGRSSVDIIKSGGYKLSALEIEASLLDHPEIAQIAVVGLPDPTWGEVVAATIVRSKVGDPSLRSLSDLRQWCDGKISKYKTPTRLLIVDSLPRNAMGKIQKPSVVKMFDPEVV